MTYLVIPYLRSQGANIHNASFLLGGAPVLPAYFFAHALGRKVKFNGLRFGLIHHYVHPHGQRSKYGLFYPQQRRSASFTFGSSVGRDYSSKNKHALSLQPVATADMCVSLVVECDGLRSVQEVEKVLHSARFSGGLVTSSGKPRTHASLEDAMDSLSSGFVVTDRRDLLERRADKNQAQLFVETLGARPVKNTQNGWLSAACLGYATISPFERRIGSREGYLHAFVEPLVGIVQYRSLRQCREGGLEELLWQSEWINDDVFRVYQGKRN